MKNKIIINNNASIHSILLVMIPNKLSNNNLLVMMLNKLSYNKVISKLLIILVYNKCYSKIIRLIEKLLRLITIRWKKEVQSKYI